VGNSEKAKVDITKALELNPENEIAKKGMRDLEG